VGQTSSSKAMIATTAKADESFVATIATTVRKIVTRRRSGPDPSFAFCSSWARLDACAQGRKSVEREARRKPRCSRASRVDGLYSRQHCRRALQRSAAPRMQASPVGHKSNCAILHGKGSAVEVSHIVMPICLRTPEQEMNAPRCYSSAPPHCSPRGRA
jgi:hypothetical protein